MIELAGGIILAVLAIILAPLVISVAFRTAMLPVTLINRLPSDKGTIGWKFYTVALAVFILIVAMSK